MNGDAGREILELLRRAPRAGPHRTIQGRPASSGVEGDRAGMVLRFTEEASSQGVTVHRASGGQELAQVLTASVRAQGIRRMVACASGAVSALDLGRWAVETGVEVVDSSRLGDRGAVREAAFTADAALTPADFAVAESGTLVMAFDSDHQRLLSVAAPAHFAVVAIDDLVMSYEEAFERLLRRRKGFAGQVCFITGPSSTSDIQAVQFKGMHGPARLEVILLDTCERKPAGGL
ncbi:MAG TPA: lactate utilization protein [Deltaproteobacteria bacterium]|nr:lactate utilization protein [Deltaproteobacteria bacterium]HPP79421.1 lactate utilization protein [Deltaproteobacteria bacterium]